MQSDHFPDDDPFLPRRAADSERPLSAIVVAAWFLGLLLAWWGFTFLVMWIAGKV